MRDLASYLQTLLEEEGGAPMSTPANTMGMGDINPNTEPLLAAPEGGIPHQATRISNRRKKKRRKDLRDFIMTGKMYNT